MRAQDTKIGWPNVIFSLAQVLLRRVREMIKKFGRDRVESIKRETSVLEMII